MKKINLTIGDIIVLKKRFYRLSWSKWDNGKKQGNRAILILLNNEDLNKLLLKGGLK